MRHFLTVYPNGQLLPSTARLFKPSGHPFPVAVPYRIQIKKDHLTLS